MKISPELADSVFIPETDTETIQRLETLLSQAHPKLVGIDGEEIALPDSVYQALRQVIHMMAAGQRISLVPYEHHLSSQEAANLLNISCPYLYTLLDQGEIAYIKIGTHRRIRFEDLMQYKQKRDNQRHQSLTELTEISQELGFYSSTEPSSNSPQ